MWWRLPRPAFNAGKGEGNQRAMKRLVTAGVTPGLLAFEGSRAVGWCAVSPRGDLPGLARSRVLAPVDDAPAWSISCLFVARDRRKSGLTGKLIDAAVRFAKRHGAAVVEGYPVEPGPQGTADAFAFTGLASTFRKAGFTEAARRSATRAVYRKSLSPRR
jgi:GNAT superfamily N-acetyltransferase